MSEAETTPSGGAASSTPRPTRAPRAAAAPAERESAAGEVTTDAMGNEIEKVPSDPTAVPAESTETGVGGLALPPQGEIGGGNIKAVLLSPDQATAAQKPMVKEQAAMLTAIGQKIAGLIGRPVTEWGVLGPGDTVKGQMLLLDLNSGEKVRGMDGHKIKDGELYMNLRNVPEALATGDTIERVLGA